MCVKLHFHSEIFTCKTMKVSTGYFRVAFCQILIIDKVVEDKRWGHGLGQTLTRVSHEHQSSTLGSDNNA